MFNFRDYLRECIWWSSLSSLEELHIEYWSVASTGVLLGFYGASMREQSFFSGDDSALLQLGGTKTRGRRVKGSVAAVSPCFWRGSRRSVRIEGLANLQKELTLGPPGFSSAGIHFNF